MSVSPSRSLPRAAGPAARPLLVTNDDRVLDVVLRLAETSGFVLDVAHDVDEARRRWRTASLAIVSVEIAVELARSAPMRRSGVLLVGPTDLDPGVALWQSAVRLGAEDVLTLPDHEGILAARLIEVFDAGRDPGVVVSVMGGRGGAGATTLAVALAVSAQRARWPTALVDGDPHGGGVDLMLGAEDVPGARWYDLADAEGRVGPRALVSALPSVDDLVVVSTGRDGPRRIPPEAMRSVLAAARGFADLVVADLPRHPDEAAAEVLAASAVVLLVVPAEIRAIAAARRMIRLVEESSADVRIVVRGPAPGRLGAADIVAALNRPIAAWLAPEAGLAREIERGEPPGRGGHGPLVSFCRAFLAELGELRESTARASGRAAA